MKGASLMMSSSPGIRYLRMIVPVFLLSLQACSDLPDIRISDGPNVLETDENSILITWTTNVPSDSRVRFGLNTKLEQDTLLNFESEYHEVPLLRLSPDTVWYFEVESRSEYFPGKAVSQMDSLITPSDYRRSYGLEEYLKIGWNHMNESDYNAANSAFVRTLQLDAYSAEAHAGFAWSLLMLKLYPDDAFESLNRALSIDRNYADALAGRAVCYLIMERFTSAVSDLNSIFASDSSYSSPNMPALIHTASLKTLEAYAYSQLGDLHRAEQACRMADPDFSITETDSESWVVNDIHYSSYAAALIQAIYSYLNKYGWLL